ERRDVQQLAVTDCGILADARRVGGELQEWEEGDCPVAGERDDEGTSRRARCPDESPQKLDGDGVQRGPGCAVNEEPNKETDPLNVAAHNLDVRRGGDALLDGDRVFDERLRCE